MSTSRGMDAQVVWCSRDGSCESEPTAALGRAWTDPICRSAEEARGSASRGGGHSAGDVYVKFFSAERSRPRLPLGMAPREDMTARSRPPADFSVVLLGTFVRSRT